MDIESVLKMVVALNCHIQNSLVKKGVQLNEKGTEIAKLINVGKMIYDSERGVEKPDVHWVKAILELQNIKDTQTQEVLDYYLSDLQQGTKPYKFAKFITEWQKWTGKNEYAQPRVASNIDSLMKAAKYIEKSADNIGTKVRLARLVDSHIGHIVGLVNKGDVAQAKEYLEVIRPQGWEANNERNVDKLYELVVRGLAEKLDPEAFQVLGL